MFSARRFTLRTIAAATIAVAAILTVGATSTSNTDAIAPASPTASVNLTAGGTCNQYDDPGTRFYNPGGYDVPALPLDGSIPLVALAQTRALSAYNTFYAHPKPIWWTLDSVRLQLPGDTELDAKVYVRANVTSKFYTDWLDMKDRGYSVANIRPGWVNVQSAYDGVREVNRFGLQKVVIEAMYHDPRTGVVFLIRVKLTSFSADSFQLTKDFVTDIGTGIVRGNIVG